MEGVKLTGYETSEPESLRDSVSETETKAGTVKHNGSMGLLTDPLESRQAGTTRPSALMANDLLTPAPTSPQGTALPGTGHELDAFLGKAFEEQPVWVRLWESIRDVFFPVKLPPLQLTSKPIPVPDRMAVKANPWAIGISTTVNVIILLVVLFLVGRKIVEAVKPSLMATNIDVGDYKAPKDTTKAGGGGGGGDRSLIDANKGKLPKLEKDPITPPQPQTIEHPKLPEEAAINVQKEIQLPDNDMPVIGVHSSANVNVQSAGTGSGAGMGTGSGGGLGSGNGDGYGPGSGGNTGGGLYQIGGRVSAPVVLHSVEAEFSDEARRAKYQGVCLISLIVDAQGNPQNIRVARPLGMGLDEKAIEAIRQYKFKPAMKDSKTPVPVMITIEVDFRLY
jgi:periplasmic protein TonB